MLHFTKLRLSGFKSFVDQTDLLIEPGMTGIIGPNGCGKSNLVEALRWVMGETSAKQMRGGEMDDVIFSGTAQRPARNFGEVLLSLDNSTRAAPAAFNDAPELEISRKIERGEGSTYRVNGKEVRARDVQLLFADQATGARSTALVSQGRVNLLIQQKPQQRRHLLEEAAGITGLHSRRHEAELRLRAAETNLTRLDDVLAALDAQLQSLKKQARQATRYRNISGHIRTAQATLFLLRWLAAVTEREDARAALEQIEAQVVELTSQAAQLATIRTEAAAGLPELRRIEAETAAELHRLSVARDGLDAELKRVEASQIENTQRLEQVGADLDRERLLAADALEAVQTLETEQAGIEQGHEARAQATLEAAEHLAQATASVEQVEARLTDLTERAAADQARKADLERRSAELAQRIQRLTDRAADVERQRQALVADAIDPVALEAAEKEVNTARETLTMVRTEADTAEQARARAAEASAAGAILAQKVDASLANLEAEHRALSDVLKSEEGGLFPPMIDAVQVDPGYETALGAALGEDLSAPADEPAPIHWRTLDPFAEPLALPAGAEPLEKFVRGPAALRRRLSQIGVVADAETGNRLANELKQGQRLVDRSGGLWRWDGFVIGSGAQTAAAARLEQRARLKIVRDRIVIARGEAIAAAGHLRGLQSAATLAAEIERDARDAVRRADLAYSQARDKHTDLRQGAAQHESQMKALVEAATGFSADMAESQAQIEAVATALAEVPDLAQAREVIASVRMELAERRTGESDCRAAHDRLLRETEEKARRLAEIARELTSWRDRGEGANRRMAELEERRQAVGAELERLALLPAEIEAKRQTLITSIEASEARRGEAADNLAAAEARLAEADKAARLAESALAAAREERVRIEGRVEQGEQACRSLTERIAEQLDCQPDALREVADLKDDDDLPLLETIEKRVERLIHERDTMGPVNLRAEQESAEVGQQVETLQAERSDLIGAIEKLRKGINELNREGRERLLASFKEVDGHFQRLFTRLFGGGAARLELTDTEDPLEAGLEIMASPPGKRMQILSLLSGGEQALTALSLLFAVFLVNPAPICVLDEVDAPLDDANVDRFCSLVDEIAHSSGTRFLIITHHRLTMARMDRLFGVTMAERGVSQLVSVDLRRAQELRATA